MRRLPEWNRLEIMESMRRKTPRRAGGSRAPDERRSGPGRDVRQVSRKNVGFANIGPIGRTAFQPMLSRTHHTRIDV